MLESSVSVQMINLKQYFSSVKILNQPMYIDVPKNPESLVTKETRVISSMSNRDVLMSADFVPVRPNSSEKPLVHQEADAAWSESALLRKIDDPVD